MGNQSTCQRFCEHKQQQHQNQMTSELRINEYPLECEICNKEVQHTRFKSHLDQQHFASIEEKNQHISVVCILCDGINSDLQGHRLHLIEKHPYVKIGLLNSNHIKSQQSILFSQNSPSYSPYNNNKLHSRPELSNKTIKSKLKSIESISRLRVIKQPRPNQFIIQYQSEQYLMYKQSKQYNGMEYDQSLVYPQLVLYPALTLYKQRVRYFLLEKCPLEKTIQCNAYLICDKEHL